MLELFALFLVSTLLDTFAEHVMFLIIAGYRFLSKYTVVEKFSF